MFVDFAPDSRGGHPQRVRAILHGGMDQNPSVCSITGRFQVLHLIGMALLEEQQQLENIGDDREVNFNFILKISRKFCTSHTIESLKPVVDLWFLCHGSR
ncbi:hypothetical protein AMELA_G00289710 [Ameiurus melas]|uniref:Uncharacterized protein n=1 Tax=Ameiurus melas TaxID=219545 RepID=A0A7J5ZK06_AMEME|nr:hypothetical protein AMELA_G00289710 [Ameiurus melas]